MYLITKEIYDKLLLSIDERDKKKIALLNRHEVGNENGAFPQVPPPPPPPPPPQPPRRPSTLDDDMDDTMDFAPNTSPPDTPGGDREFHFPGEDNYIDDEISSNANNLYIDRFPSTHKQNLVHNQDFVEPRPPANNLYIDRLPSTHRQNLIPNQDFVETSNTSMQPKPSTSKKTDNKTLIKKSKKPILYKNIPQAKEVPFEIINSTNQNDTPMPPPAPETNLTQNLTQALGNKIKQSNKCQICDLQFQSRVAILKHRKEVHPKQTKTRKKRLIVLPVLKAEKEKKYGNWSKDAVIPNTEGDSDDIAVQECKLCNTEFNKHNALIRHLAAIHDCSADYVPFREPANKRKISQTAFPYSKTPKKKFGKHFYKCKLCSFTFAGEDALNRHTENIHDILNIDGVNKYALPKGIKRKELAETEVFKCTICFTDFENKSYYISHLRLKHGVDQNYVKNEAVVKNRRKERVTKSNKKLKEKYDGW